MREPLASAGPVSLFSTTTATQTSKEHRSKFRRSSKRLPSAGPAEQALSTRFSLRKCRYSDSLRRADNQRRARWRRIKTCSANSSSPTTTPTTTKTSERRQSPGFPGGGSISSRRLRRRRFVSGVGPEGPPVSVKRPTVKAATAADSGRSSWAFDPAPARYQFRPGPGRRWPRWR